MTSLIGPCLRSRLRTAGAEPLFTYYEPDAGVRIELSAVTFANWVDKTSNLLVDEELLEPGDVVALDLAVTAPGHWMTAVWQVACWQVGLHVAVGMGSGAGPTPRLVVTGPTGAGTAPHPGVDVLACSLHPLGLELTERPAGVRDYAAEVRGQADTFAPSPVSGLATAWTDQDRAMTQTDLVATAEVESRRRMIRPEHPWTTARDGIVTALVSGGSVVAVVGGDEQQWQHLAETERVDVPTPTPAPSPREGGTR